MKAVGKVCEIFVLCCICGALALAAGEDESFRLHAADLYSEQGRYDLACRAYDEAVRNGADLQTDAVRARRFGEACLSATPPDLARATKWLQFSLHADPASLSTRASLAQALLRSGFYDAAADQYRALLAAQPGNADYALSLAGALRQAGNQDAALKILQRTLEQYPDFKIVRIEYGRLLNALKRFDDAKKQFTLVLQQDPGNLPAGVGLAKATSWQGDQESALKIYNRILQQNPSLYDAQVGKAFSLLWMGHKSDARELLEAAHHRYPQDREVADALAGLGEAPGRNRTARQKASASEQRQQQLSARTSKPSRPIETETDRIDTQASHASQDRGPQPILETPATATAPAGTAANANAQSPSQLRNVVVALIGGIALTVVLRKIVQKRLRAQGAVPITSNTPVPTHNEIVLRAAATSSNRMPGVAQIPSSPELNVSSESNLRGKRILVFGKDSSVVGRQRELLIESGADVVTFTAWETALEWLKTNEPAVILLNAFHQDHWIGLRLYAWMEKYHPALALRTVVAISDPDRSIEAYQQSIGARCILHPLRASELIGGVERASLQTP
jgi:tetratricopeptide (TPR) repeat protein